MDNMDVDEKDLACLMKKMIMQVKGLQLSSNYEKGLVPIQKDLGNFPQLKLTKNLVILHQTTQSQTFNWPTAIRSVKKWKLWNTYLTNIGSNTSTMWVLFSDLSTGNERQAQNDATRLPIVWTQPIQTPSGTVPALSDQIPPIEYVLDFPIDFQTFTFNFQGDIGNITWNTSDEVSALTWVLELDCINGFNY
jgi:hypothetical protein